VAGIVGGREVVVVVRDEDADADASHSVAGRKTSGSLIGSSEPA